jgi:hypothetical protein
MFLSSILATLIAVLAGPAWMLLFPIVPLIGLALFVTISLFLIFLAVMIVGTLLTLLLVALITVPASAR